MEHNIKLNHRAYQWMLEQTPEVQRVLGHLIYTHWPEWKTPSLCPLDFQELFIELTNGADLEPGCKALDKLFHYYPVIYREG